ncbi:MAG: AraC family transcriptional regulator [Pseudomonadota bacterium]
MSRSSTVQHSVLGTFILPIASALRAQGIDAIDVVTEVGVDPAKAANPDWRVSHEHMNRLMQYSVELTGDEAFGLLAADYLQPQALHGLGLAWLASDTVYDGLKRLVRFGRLINTGLDMSLQEEGTLARLVMAPLLPEEQDFCHARRDYYVAMVVRMCRLTLGDFLAPVAIALDRPTPHAPERWEYHLASRVSFDHASTMLDWSLADIGEPLITGDPALARVNDEQTQIYLDSFLAQSTCRAVVARIVERLPDGMPSQQDIADELHISNRTLQRKLKEEGTSFKELVQDTRLQLARKYLLQPSRSIVETSYLLGFSEPSTFSRAFKRWTGQAPAEFRDRPQ